MLKTTLKSNMLSPLWHRFLAETEDGGHFYGASVITPNLKYQTPGISMAEINMSNLSKRLVFLLPVSMILVTIVLGQVAPAAAQAKPNYGGTLRMLYQQDPQTLNSVLKYWTVTGQIQMLLTGKLLKFDEGYNIVPELAKSYTVSPDGKVWTFKLRDDVYWHDGEKFTSADVKWHYENMMKYTTYKSVRLQRWNFTAVEAPDDYTVVFRFLKLARVEVFGPSGGSQDERILPMHIYKGTDFEKNPANTEKYIGNGPFKLKEYVKDKHIILVANEKYFEGRPYLDQVIITYQRDPAAALVALEAGQVDLIHPAPGVPLAEVERVNKVAGLKAGGYSYHVTWRLAFNFRDECAVKYPWVRDVKVRRAIAYAIDRQTIINKVLGGIPLIAEGPISQLIKPYYDDASVMKYEYSIAKAESLLDEAGYKKGPDGIRFKCPLIGYASAAADGLMEPIRAELRKVGIDVELRPIEDTAFFATYEHGPGAARGMQDYPFAMGTMVGGPWPWATWWAQPPPPGEDFGFYSTYRPRQTEIFNLMDAEPSEARLKELSKEQQRLCTEDCAYVFLWHAFQTVAWKDEFADVVENFKPAAYLAPRFLRAVWWKKASPPTPTTTVKPTTTVAPPQPAGPDTTTIAAVLVVAVVLVGAYIFSKRRKGEPQKT